MEWGGKIRIVMFSVIRTKISGHIQSTDMSYLHCHFNPLKSMSDQERISSYNI